MDQGWVQGLGRTIIPDVKFLELPEGYYPRAFHGSKYTLAVFNSEDKCVGWMLAESCKVPSNNG